MTLNEATNLNEELALIKFKYDAEGRHDRKPRVIVIDLIIPEKLGNQHMVFVMTFLELI